MIIRRTLWKANWAVSKIYSWVNRAQRLQFLLATLNHGKVREIRKALAGIPIQLQSLEGKALPAAVESGSTFRENAYLKAEHYYRLTGIPTLGEDSGLLVDALDGKPGVYSARLAPTDEKRIARLLALMTTIPDGVSRKAHFVSVFCLYLPHRTLETRGTVEGEITQAPRGRMGFGYDPIFYYPPFGKTFAEMGSEEKNGISHRGRALAKLREKLRQLTTDN